MFVQPRPQPRRHGHRFANLRNRTATIRSVSIHVRCGSVFFAVLLNKTDLGMRVDPGSLAPFLCVPASLAQGTGVPGLKAAIARLAGASSHAEPHAAISERHRKLIQDCFDHLSAAIRLLRSNNADREPLAAATLRSALISLGTVTGRNFDDDLLASIFNTFCIGK